MLYFTIVYCSTVGQLSDNLDLVLYLYLDEITVIVHFQEMTQESTNPYIQNMISTQTAHSLGTLFPHRTLSIVISRGVYSKTPLLRPPLREKGLYIGVVLLLS